MATTEDWFNKVFMSPTTGLDMVSSARAGKTSRRTAVPSATSLSWLETYFCLSGVDEGILVEDVRQSRGFHILL